MIGLTRLLWWDLVLQIRQGFWFAALFALLPGLGILLSISQTQADFILPAILFFDVSIAGTLFMAGVFFFEKRERSIYGLAVTPIQTWQWLASKLISLTLICMAMTLVLVVLKKGYAVSWGLLLIATVCGGVLFSLFGFILVVPFEKFLNFFTAFAPFFLVMELPGLIFFGIEHPLYWAIPTHSTLLLMRGAFGAVSMTTFWIALGVQLVWIAACFVGCLWAFHRYVVDRREG